MPNMVKTTSATVSGEDMKYVINTAIFHIAYLFFHPCPWVKPRKIFI